VLGPNGKSVMTTQPVMAQQIKPTVPVADARAGALATARYSPSKWGGPASPGGEATKVVERASRDAVKQAVPETKPLFRAASDAIPARDALRIQANRDASRDMIGLPASAGQVAAAASGRPSASIVGMAIQKLKDKGLPAAIYLRDLEKALATGGPQAVGRYLQKLGVSLTSQGLDDEREGSMTITEPK
jgi:hypothetical protein